jgi:hypothetical protein
MSGGSLLLPGNRVPGWVLTVTSNLGLTWTAPGLPTPEDLALYFKNAEIPPEPCNSVNRDFTTSVLFVPGTLKVWRDGVLLTSVGPSPEVVENGSMNGFRVNTDTPPRQSEVIVCSFIKQ